MSKTIEQYFIDWESHVFGYGYGTGEQYILPLVRQFLFLCPDTSNRERVAARDSSIQDVNVYSYTKLESELGHAVAWMLINTFGHAGLIEYGSSPRFGWLTEEGRALRTFMLSKHPEELLELAVGCAADYFHCTPSYCNCGPDGYEKSRVCDNPFWPKKG